MKGNELLEKMELVDSKYVLEAERKPIKRKKKLAAWIAAAACICIICGGGLILGPHHNTSNRDLLTPVTVNAMEIDGMGYSLANAGKNITTASVKNNGWRTFVSNGEYILNSDFFNSKIDLDSGVMSKFYPETENKESGFVSRTELFFIFENRVYFKYSLITYDEDELEEEGEVQNETTDFLAWYDLETGESHDIMSVICNGIEQFFAVIHDGEYLYYDRYLPNESLPETADDYLLYFCRMNMESEREEVLFAFPDNCSSESYGFPDPLAVEDGKAYFTLNKSGRLLRVNIDGSEPTYLIDCDDGFRGLYDGFGTFLCDGKIYYLQCENVEETELIPHNKNCLYRIDCMTGEREKLTDEYVSWLFVSDDSVFYQLSWTQPEGVKEVPADFSEYIIKEVSHEGVEKATYRFRSENSAISGVGGGGDYLFFLTGYHIYSDDESKIEPHSPVTVYNIKTGEYSELYDGKR